MAPSPLESRRAATPADFQAAGGVGTAYSEGCGAFKT